MALVAFDKYQLQMFQSCVFFSDAIEQLFLSRTSLLGSVSLASVVFWNDCPPGVYRMGSAYPSQKGQVRVNLEVGGSEGASSEETTNNTVMTLYRVKWVLV